MDENTSLQREVRAFYEITLAINSSLNQQDVLDTMLEHIVHALGYKAATLRLLDKERQDLELKAAYGLSKEYLTKGRVDVEMSGIDLPVLAGHYVTVVDVRSDPGFQYRRAAAHEGLISALAVPLRLRDNVIGVLHVYTADVHTFAPEEQAFLATIANLGAQAIQRSHLYEAFRTIAQHLSSSLDLKEVLTTLLLESVEHLNVKAGTIRLLGPRRETLHLAAAYGLSTTYLQKGAVHVAHSPIDQQILQQTEPTAISDLTQSTGFQYAEEAQREGIRSVLVLPLRVRDTSIGVMRMYSGQVRHFNTEEIAFAATVANLGAVAIENAKLHEVLKSRLEALKEDASGWYRFLTMS